MAKTLTFADLRNANRARLPIFKNKHGKAYHTEVDGAEWSLSDWLMATMGELGELANLLKKVRREDLTLDEARPELANELADVACYLDILALRCGVDLGQAVIDKFNAVSARVGVDVFIRARDL